MASASTVVRYAVTLPRERLSARLTLSFSRIHSLQLGCPLFQFVLDFDGLLAGGMEDVLMMTSSCNTTAKSSSGHHRVSAFWKWITEMEPYE